MKMQSKVVLSIGSNQGDKSENIQKCIQSIHLQLGTVVQVSSLYETPAWGFSSENFYNCAILLHTYLKPSQILKKILQIEQELGRKRVPNQGYQARIIDIDIVCIDDIIIETENLTIPHPLMQERNFVLLPMSELLSDWKHPITNKTIKELIETSKDQGYCKFVKNLENPLDHYGFHNIRYIAIEGNIGAGKTTLVSKMAEDFNAKKVLERFADNSFLPKFYKDQERYAFPLEMSFLADRYKQLTDDIAQLDLFKDFVFADYHIFKSLIFSKITLPEDEYKLYRNFFEIIYKEMIKPELYIYLYQNPERLLKNIKKRGRSYEQEIQPEYLEKINKGYLEYIRTISPENVLIIDVSSLDFVKNHTDYILILEQIKDKIKKQNLL